MATGYSPLNMESPQTRRGSSTWKFGITICVVAAIAAVGVYTSGKSDANKDIVAGADDVGEVVGGDVSQNKARPDYSSSSVMVRCSIGKYKRAGRCRVCERGHKCPGNQRKYPCRKGYYQNRLGQRACLPAPCGAFVSMVGSTMPRKCGPGTYQPKRGQSMCMNTQPGQYSLAGACKPLTCMKGSYQPSAHQSGCIQAKCGYFVAGMGARAQVKCKAGKYSAAGATQCSTTMAGHFSAAGACQPTPCEPGTYQPSSGSSSCLKATCGNYVPGKGATKMMQCKGGEYSLNDGASSCTTTKPGWYAHPGACYPIECFPGFWQGKAGQTYCQSADCGHYVPAKGATSQMACVAPMYQPAKGKSNCVMAPKGTMVKSNGACAAMKCPMGYFQMLMGQKMCRPCPMNMYSNAMGATSCMKCPAGQCAPVGSKMCKACPKKKKSSSEH